MQNGMITTNGCTCILNSGYVKLAFTKNTSDRNTYTDDDIHSPNNNKNHTER